LSASDAFSQERFELILLKNQAVGRNSKQEKKSELILGLSGPDQRSEATPIWNLPVGLWNSEFSHTDDCRKLKVGLVI